MERNMIMRTDFVLGVLNNRMLRVKKLVEHARLPRRQSLGAAGYDLFAIEDIVIPPKNRAAVGTGIAIAIPEGTYGRIAPRSGLAVKYFVDVGAGVIDRDYRGEVKVVLFNHSTEQFEVKQGDCIAQLIIEEIILPNIVEIDHLEETPRGRRGFGSTLRR